MQSAEGSQGSTSSIREQVRRAVDPTGKQSMMLAAIDAAPDLYGWLSTLDREVAGQFASMAARKDEYVELLRSMEDALEVLVPRGWAPFNMDSAVVASAVALVRSGRPAEADALLAGQWEDGRLTSQVCSRVSVMGAGEGEHAYHDLFKQRARLLRKAHEHHQAGRYDASIPIIHAQIEGLVIDLSSGKKFFTKGPQKANLNNPTQLVSIEACLSTLQAIFGEGVGETQAAGSLSRHAIAHGRELAYDTRENSAKTWSVIHALVQWAQPLAQQEAQRLRRDREAQNAGVDGANENGQRIDNREFRETRAMLRKLLTPAMAQLSQQGALRRAIIGDLYRAKDFQQAGLPADPGIEMRRSADGKIIWFWRATVSGWVLGAAVGLTGQGFDEWLYSGPTPPLESPNEAPALWGNAFDTPADWRS